MSVLLQIVGLAALTAGCWLIWPPIGLIVFGFAVLTLGALMENDTPKAD